MKSFRSFINFNLLKPCKQKGDGKGVEKGRCINCSITRRSKRMSNFFPLDGIVFIQKYNNF